jgi:hypothetical protein
MKNLIFATLALVATLSSAFAAETPNVVRASLELKKNGLPVSTFELSMLEGHPSPYRSVTTHKYGAKCEPNSLGVTESTESSLETGITATVAPLQVTADGALLYVGFSYSEMSDMKTVKSTGCTIDVPSTLNFGHATAVHVTSGQPVELASTLGRDKYVLVVRKL